MGARGRRGGVGAPASGVRIRHVRADDAPGLPPGRRLRGDHVPLRVLRGGTPARAPVPALPERPSPVAPMAGRGWVAAASGPGRLAVRPNMSHARSTASTITNPFGLPAGRACSGGSLVLLFGSAGDLPASIVALSCACGARAASTASRCGGSSTRRRSSSSVRARPLRGTRLRPTAWSVRCCWAWPSSGIPAASAIAIFKYRLYDIDVVINKTVVFGALAAFITAVYVAIVVGMGVGDRHQGGAEPRPVDPGDRGGRVSCSNRSANASSASRTASSTANGPPPTRCCRASRRTWRRATLAMISFPG